MTHIYHQLPHRHKQLLIAASIVTAILFLLPSDDAKASRSDSNDATLKVAQRYQVDIDSGRSTLVPVETPIKQSATKEGVLRSAPVKTAVEQVPAIPQKIVEELATIAPPKLQWQSVEVKAGDSLALIFDRAGFSPRTLYDITSVGKATKALKKIMPGQIIKFGENHDGELQELRYQQDIITTLVVTTTDKGYQANTEKRELETREKLASAVIDSNFWNAGISAGLEPSVIMNLANIFGWDIDFGLDIRKGDHFNIIYETKFLDGIEVKTGQIIAAEFVNQGQSYQAIRHTDGEYYSASGRSMRKAFLRAPVNFKYISSNFNPRRLHPVTKTIKAHNGIDYAAKRGTPVQASGSGTVTDSGYSRFNGNYVFIKHGEKYLTKYLHLHKRSVRKGQRVKQGQKIGTVGATGRVTGVHLHYEFLVNGVHRNPRTVKLPKSQPIAKKEKTAFLATAKTRMAQLETNKRIMLASNQEP